MNINKEKLANYETFVKSVTEKINRFFDDQKEYIFCSNGCTLCCCNAQFPFSRIEFEYLMQGFLLANEVTKLNLIKNVNSTLNSKREFEKENPSEDFIYNCPMLINNSCALYDHRGLLCRSFGLLTHQPNSEEKQKMPFCAYKGLNYSNVIDVETKTMSEEKYKSQKLKVIPKSYNISYTALTDKSFEESFDFKFGEIKPLIEWFEDELSNFPK